MANELRLPIVRLDRRVGWRRFGEVARDRPAQLRAVQPRLGVGGREPRDRCPSWACASARSRGSVRHASSRATTRVMVRDTSHLFVAGPPIVNRLGMETVDKESLGGAAIHGRNGVVDDVVDTEHEAFDRARRFLSYLPSSVHALPPRSPNRPTIPSGATTGWSARSPVSGAASTRCARSSTRSSTRDRSSRSARATAAARSPGSPVSTVGPSRCSRATRTSTARAGPPTRRARSSGSSTSPRRSTCPVVHLVDNPGFVIGVAAEQEATIRHGARALAAIYQATVPWCSVILRKVYGVAGAAHQNASRLSYRFAWPSGNWGSLPLEGGIEAAYKAQLESRRRSRGAPGRDRVPARAVAVAVPHRRGVHDRGDHRPARHPTPALRVRRARRTPAHARARPLTVPAVGTVARPRETFPEDLSM